MFKADIIALQELRWKEIGEDNTKYQCDIYHSGYPERREFGVGFAVKGKARFCISRWEPILARDFAFPESRTNSTTSL